MLSKVPAYIHCKENSTYVFLFWELRGLSPDFHIHVSVGQLYIKLYIVIYKCFLCMGM
jgi:hypothetical protein